MESWESVDKVLKGELSSGEFLGLLPADESKCTKDKCDGVVFEDGTKLSFNTVLPSSLILSRTSCASTTDDVKPGSVSFPLTNMLHFGFVHSSRETALKPVAVTSHSKDE